MNAKSKQDLAHARELLRAAYKFVSDATDKARDAFECLSWKAQTSAKGEREEEDIFTLEEIRDGLKRDAERIKELLEEDHDEI